MNTKSRKEYFRSWVKKNIVKYRKMHREIMRKWAKENPEKVKKAYSKFYQTTWAKRIKQNPWLAHYVSVHKRCTSKSSPYYKKGRRLFMTIEDFKYLWLRDKAYSLSDPTIDRIDNNINYVLDNCRFIERSENSRKGNK